MIPVIFHAGIEIEICTVACFNYSGNPWTIIQNIKIKKQ
jgi:hypothetical protein